MTGQSDGQAPEDGAGTGTGISVFSALRKGAKGVWIPISLVLYAVGAVLLNGGRLLTRISGWRVNRGNK